MSKKPFTFIILILLLSLSFSFCTIHENISIRPVVRDVESIKLDVETTQSISILDENLNTEAKYSILLNVAGVRDDISTFNLSMLNYEAASRIAGRKEILNFKPLRDVAFSFSLDSDGNTNINEIKSNVGNSELDIKNSIESLFSLMVKGLPNDRTVELKDTWRDSFEVPLISESSILSATTKEYVINYMFDRMDSEGIADLLLNGRVYVKSDGRTISSEGKISGLLKFDTKKGFAIRLNVDEEYIINLKDSGYDELDEIIVKQKIVANNEIK